MEFKRFALIILLAMIFLLQLILDVAGPMIFLLLCAVIIAISWILAVIPLYIDVPKERTNITRAGQSLVWMVFFLGLALINYGSISDGRTDVFGLTKTFPRAEAGMEIGASTSSVPHRSWSHAERRLHAWTSGIQNVFGYLFSAHGITSIIAGVLLTLPPFLRFELPAWRRGDYYYESRSDNWPDKRLVMVGRLSAVALWMIS